MGRQPVDAKAAAAPHTMAPYLHPALASGPKAPDADGFLQRWLLLEPIPIKPALRGNTVFLAPYVREHLNKEYFPGEFGDALPKNGDHVKVDADDLAWHALDSTMFDVKLYNFAWGLNKNPYSNMFYAVTIVNSPRDISNVRLAVGSNSASIWKLNGQTVAELFDDRRMVADDVVSHHISLKKGKNILWGAVINGPGLSDFCVRFIDENGNPVKDITTSLQ